MVAVRRVADLAAEVTDEPQGWGAHRPTQLAGRCDVAARRARVGESDRVMWDEMR